jgi:uncharacterized membrane protein
MSKRYVIEEQKDRSGWWIILVAGFLLAYGYAILIAAIITALIALAILGWVLYRRRQQAKQVEETRAYMDAPTKLITEGMRVWGDPEHYLDHNDGMREWV